MPIITVFPDVPRAYNRVEVDWSDLPTVEFARVLRVDAVTGTCTPLRPYICFSGDYLDVSCDGHGIFWDTEVPLDRSVYYITEALSGAPCIPESTAFLDVFSRVLAAQWGVSTSGTLWLLNGGVAADYSVNGTQGLQQTGGADQIRRAMADAGSGNVVVQGQYIPQEIATGASFYSRLGVRTDATGTVDGYEVQIEYTTLSQLNISLVKNVGGVFSVVAGPLPLSTGYVIGTVVNMKIQAIGSQIKAKAWTTAGEPDTWNIEVTDTDVPVNTTNVFIAAKARTEVGNTNGALIHAFDNIMVIDDCIPCTVVTAQTEPTTMPSNGAFRLKDPLRPCNDLYVPLCFEQIAQPGCLPGSGIFFGSVSTEGYEANTMVLNPTNARYPIAVNRQRRAKSSVLQLVTRTFADRDNLLRINEPGTPLLLQGPPEYGINDAYISVGDLTVERGVTDHKYPVRINNLPFVEVVRPAGPSLGVCGSRVIDTCDIYSTWGEIVDAGLTYEDIVRGRASTEGVGDEIRTWDDVSNEFADWNAVAANGTWAQLEAGD